MPEEIRGSTVVDVGCSTGAFGAALKRSLDVCVIGIEVDPEAAGRAAAHLDEVVVDDAVRALRMLRTRPGEPPSAVVFADVLEHLIDPGGAIAQAVELLPEGGYVIASVPNVAHLDTFVQLLRGTWPMRERGIHDSAHVRFFARRDVHALMSGDRLELVTLRRNYRLVERSARSPRASAMIGRLWPNIFTFQYLTVSRVMPSPEDDDVEANVRS